MRMRIAVFSVGAFLLAACSGGTHKSASGSLNYDRINNYHHDRAKTLACLRSSPGVSFIKALAPVYTDGGIRVDVSTVHFPDANHVRLYFGDNRDDTELGMVQGAGEDALFAHTHIKGNVGVEWWDATKAKKDRRILYRCLDEVSQ